MQNFIVLGIIPGTNIQLNLNFWLAATTLLAVVLGGRLAIRLIARLRLAVALWRLTRGARRFDLVAL